MNTPLLSIASSRLPKRQMGLSLIELMIAVTIGLVMLAVMTDLLIHQNAARDEFDKSSRQIENGRYAMQLLHDDILHAGFYGQLFNIPVPTATAAMPDPCATDMASLYSGIMLPIQGYDAQSGSPLAASASGTVQTLPSCLAAANYLRGDILVVRRADSALTTIAAANAGAAQAVYMQATGNSYVINTGANATTANFNLTYATATNTGPADLRPYLVRIYFISPCSTMANGSTCAATDDNGSPIPTLKRLELSSAGTFTITPLVEGVQNMQFDYGIDSDSDGYPDSYITAPTPVSPNTATSIWANVVTVRVNLLARNNDQTVGYSDQKTYSLGLAGSVGPFNDKYKRHAYTEVVRAVNISGRRAQQ